MNQYIKEQLIEPLRRVAEKYPSLKREINELYSLAMSEIEDGGSIDHEIELALDEVEELIDNINERFEE